MRTRRCCFMFGCASACMLAPPVVSAQNAEIAGVVRDDTGGVLPGVAVVASSPALIEQSRTVFTDGSGQYRVIALQAGEYTVTFTLPGFGTITREGIVLTSTFVANIDAEMAVGGIAETILVSGESPLVDVETVQQTQALTAEVIAELPTGRSFQNLGILVPGVQVRLSQQDVGGADGANWQVMEVHGSRGDQMPLTMNGMPFNNMNNTGGGYNHTLAVNTGAVDEMTVTISGTDAESRTSGVVANTITKEGSNQFSTYIYTDFTNGDMQANNLSQELVDAGLQSVNAVRRVAEFNPAVGGPIVDDRLWFYVGYRNLVSTQWQTGSFESKFPTSSQYCRTAGGCLYNGVLVPDSRDLDPGFPFCPPDQGPYTPTRLSARQISSSHVAPLPVEARRGTDSSPHFQGIPQTPLHTWAISSPCGLRCTQPARQPAGTGSAQILRNMSPNSRRVRCPSASRSQ